MDIKAFWRAVLAQDEPEIRAYFAPDAYVNWHCTNEHFTVDEFITCLSEGSELFVPCDILPPDGKRQDRITG